VVALPTKRSEHHALRDLLESNLQALQALHDEHRRMIHNAQRAIDASNPELRDELRAIGDQRAPWVHAMAETRALLFVALRELIIGDNEAEVSMRLPQQASRADGPERRVA
jgi:hypothetical protein